MKHTNETMNETSLTFVIFAHLYTPTHYITKAHEKYYKNNIYIIYINKTLQGVIQYINSCTV